MFEAIYLEELKDLKYRVKSIIETIKERAPATGALYIGVPGGRSVVHIISALKMLEDDLLKQVHLVLVDERLSGEKNIDTIKMGGLDELIAENRFSETQIIPTQEANMPLDLVFLGVGEDGHIASLFPGSYSYLSDVTTPVITTIDDSPKPPPQRVTITYSGFSRLSSQANYILLFLGETKRDALKRYISGESVESLPSAFFRDTMDNVTIISDSKESLS